MTPSLFLNNCIFLGLPLAGLILGAIVAPRFLYSSKKRRGIQLNIFGLLLYLIPLSVVIGGLTYDSRYPISCMVLPFLKGLFFILFIFAAVEVFAIMHVLRRLERGR